MTRGTTPLHTFTLPKDVSEYSNFIITYRQNSGTVLEKKPEQCLVEGKEIKVRLTQEETLLFDSGQKAFVQIRVINEEGVAEASGVFSFPVNSVLNETILQDGEIPDYATPQDILYGKVAYAGGIKLTGEIEVRAASDELITEKGQVEIFPSGYYSEQNTVRIDPTEQSKIIPENIVETANILGVQGTAHPCEEFDDENRTARVAFSDETVLEISQQGSGIKGLDGNTDGLYAKNINTGEDTGEVIAAQNEQIAEQGVEIDALTEQNTELQTENVRLQDANAELTERNTELAEQLANSYVGMAGQIQFYGTSKINSPDIGKSFRCIYTNNNAVNALKSWSYTFVNANSTSSETNIHPLFKGDFSGADNEVAFIIVPSDITPVFQLPSGYSYRTIATLSDTTIYDIVAAANANPAEILRVRVVARDAV